MQTRLIKLRWRRKFKSSQKQVGDIGTQAEEGINKHVFARWHKLKPIWRFIASWLILVILLITLVIVQNFELSGYYQKLEGVPGGIYSEGVIGKLSNVNPIYANTEADRSVSKLIFAALLKTNKYGNLEGDLASNYTFDPSLKEYIVHLKPNLKFQDGYPLTADDVVYTINTVQNPDAQSPLFNQWQNITVSAQNKLTVIFKLPGILTSFPQNLTIGILPKHILANTPATSLRSIEFNNLHPIGAGPFILDKVNVVNGDNPAEVIDQVGLKPFSSYASGGPKLDRFIENIYANQNKMLADYKDKTLNGIEPIDLPSKKYLSSQSHIYSPLLLAEKFVFFKNSSGVLSDQSVRQALVLGSSVQSIVESLPYNTKIVNEPFLSGQFPYNSMYKEATNNFKQAITLLNNDGWTTIKKGVRYKNNQPLAFTLTINNTQEDLKVANLLKKQWQRLGAQTNIQNLQSVDFQNALSFHEYDAVLTSISIGKDPDVFVYWDSSQADIRSVSRLNFSEYIDQNSDIALESGRTRLNQAERIIKYQPFLADWQQKAPALGLYQPRLLYLTNGPLEGFNNVVLAKSVDRLNNVQNWEIKQAKATQ